jgi:hypothetical protein
MPLPLLALALLACSAKAPEDTAPAGDDTGVSGDDGGGDSGEPGGGDSASTGETGDTGGGDDTGPLPEAMVDLSASISDTVASVVWVSWTQQVYAEEVRAEYSFDDGEWRSTPAVEGALGSGRLALLGIPYSQDLTWRLVSQSGGEATTSEDQTFRTGALPENLPLVEVTREEEAAWDPTGNYLLFTLSERELLNTATPDFWVAIVDRQGRYVWLWPTERNAWSLYPKPAVNGGAILWDETFEWTVFDGSATNYVHKASLDGTLLYSWETPGMHHSFFDTDEETLFWTAQADFTDEILVSREGGDPVQQHWSCLDWFALEGLELASGGYCGSNAVDWYQPRDSVTVSLFSHEAVVELDRETWTPIWYAYPSGSRGYPLPEDAVWEWQHEPHFIADDRLLVSSGVGGERQEGTTRQEFTGTAVYEYAVDHEAQALTLEWKYETEGGDWISHYKGGAQRLPGGNTLHFYGDHGGAREVTPAGEIVWQLYLESQEDNSWIGRATLLEDLYDYVQ